MASELTRTCVARPSIGACSRCWTRRAKIAHVALARDHDRDSGQARGGNAEDVAVEVEAVDDAARAWRPQVAGQPQDRTHERGDLNEPGPQLQGLKPGRLEPSAQRALGADAGDVEIPARCDRARRRPRRTGPRCRRGSGCRP